MKKEMLEGELREEIVEAVCKLVGPESRWDDSHIEGKSHICKKVYEKIYQEQEPQGLEVGVRVVGLYGMGGIGKTNICRILCSEVSTKYCDKVCHVEFGSLSEVELLQKVLGNFTNLDARTLGKSDVEVCYGYLKNRILKQKVFLALDNVSHESMEQAKAYLKGGFGDGSVVLVTAHT